MLFSETFRVCSRERLLLWLWLRLWLRLVFVGSSIGRNPSALDVSLAMKGFGFAASSASHIHTLFLGLIPTVFTPSRRYHHHHHRLHLPSLIILIYMYRLLLEDADHFCSLCLLPLYVQKERTILLVFFFCFNY